MVNVSDTTLLHTRNPTKKVNTSLSLYTEHRHQTNIMRSGLLVSSLLMIQYATMSTPAPFATPTMPPSSALPNLDDRELAHIMRAATASPTAPTAPPAHVQAQPGDSDSSSYAHVDLESKLSDLVIPQSIKSCTNTTVMTATASADCVIRSELPA